MIKIFTCFKVIENTICLYIWANRLIKVNYILENVGTKTSCTYELMVIISKLILYSFNFFVDYDFYLHLKNFKIEDSLEYWKKYDLKKYFNLKEFWLLNMDNIVDYLNYKISRWERELDTKVFPSLTNVDKIQRFIIDVLMREKLIDSVKLDLWVHRIKKIIMKIQDSNRSISIFN